MEIGVAVLAHRLVEMHRAAVNAHRRSRLHSAHLETKPAQLLRDAVRRRLRDASATDFHAAYMHQTIEKRTSGQHHRLRLERDPHSRAHTSYPAVLNDKFHNRVLPHVKAVGVLNAASPSLDKLNAVGLRTRTPHRRTLRPVQHPELYRSLVGDNAHLSAKSIYLSDYLTFSNTTYSRIATHLGNLVHIHRDKQRLRAQIG